MKWFCVAHKSSVVILFVLSGMGGGQGCTNSTGPVIVFRTIFYIIGYDIHVTFKAGNKNYWLSSDDYGTYMLT